MSAAYPGWILIWSFYFYLCAGSVCGRNVLVYCFQPGCELWFDKQILIVTWEDFKYLETLLWNRFTICLHLIYMYFCICEVTYLKFLLAAFKLVKRDTACQGIVTINFRCLHHLFWVEIPFYSSNTTGESR